MSKRFKTRRRFRISSIFKLLIFFLCIYLIYCYIFKNININHDDLVNDIISYAKDNYKDSLFIDKYLSPDYLISNTFFDKESNDVLVNEDINLSKKFNVYIYSTHDNEEYYDKNLEFYNIVPNIKTVQYILKDYLDSLNINVLIEDRSVANVLKENNWNYSKSYEASRLLISNLILNNDFDLIIDLHRDSGIKDYTTLEYNDKKYAKFLFIIGGDNDNYIDNNDIAVKLDYLLNKRIDGISRGIRIKSGEGVNGIYNQDLSNKLILIELGGQYNEIEELNNSLEILSLCIYDYLEGNYEE